MALTEPVAVTHNSRERTAMISADEYHRLKRRSHEVLTIADFSDVGVEMLKAVRSPDSSTGEAGSPDCGYLLRVMVAQHLCDATRGVRCPL